jgi:hypothetical protein
LRLEALTVSPPVLQLLSGPGLAAAATADAGDAALVPLFPPPPALLHALSGMSRAAQRAITFLERTD